MCRYKCTQKNITRMYIAEHESQCDFKPQECEFCAEPFPSRDIQVCCVCVVCVCVCVCEIVREIHHFLATQECV